MSHKSPITCINRVDEAQILEVNLPQGVTQEAGAVFINVPNLSPISVIKFMTFVLVKTGPNLVFIVHIFSVICNSALVEVLLRFLKI